jgi:sugar phosphate isomerase/epimerase
MPWSIPLLDFPAVLGVLHRAGKHGWLVVEAEQAPTLALHTRTPAPAGQRHRCAILFWTK